MHPEQECRLEALIQSSLGERGLEVHSRRRGRIRGLILFDIYTQLGGLPHRIASIALFCGQPPIYRPWIEAYNINPRIGTERSIMELPSSPIESSLLDSLTEPLGPGDRFFIEYYWDWETLTQLEHGVPVIASRLGYELYRRGFTWFKVWYYPEGFNEGGQKIQAEKPLSEEHRSRHLAEHLAELREFLDRFRIPPSPEIGAALSRARRLVKEIERLLE